ncbi:MAG: VOC family protein, partial [Novosphingobium sp.]
LEPAKVAFASDEEPDEVYNRRWFLKEGTMEKNPLGGQHHVCFEVPDIHVAKAEFEAMGKRVLGEPRIGAHGTLIFFVHPKDMGGILTEIMETPKGTH